MFTSTTVTRVSSSRVMLSAKSRGGNSSGSYSAAAHQQVVRHDHHHASRRSSAVARRAVPTTSDPNNKSTISTKKTCSSAHHQQQQVPSLAGSLSAAFERVRRDAVAKVVLASVARGHYKAWPHDLRVILFRHPTEEDFSAVAASGAAAGHNSTRQQQHSAKKVKKAPSRSRNADIINDLIPPRQTERISPSPALRSFLHLCWPKRRSHHGATLSSSSSSSSSSGFVSTRHREPRGTLRVDESFEFLVHHLRRVEAIRVPRRGTENATRVIAQWASQTFSLLCNVTTIANLIRRHRKNTNTSNSCSFLLPGQQKADEAFAPWLARSSSSSAANNFKNHHHDRVVFPHLLLPHALHALDLFPSAMSPASSQSVLLAVPERHRGTISKQHGTTEFIDLSRVDPDIGLTAGETPFSQALVFPSLLDGDEGFAHDNNNNNANGDNDDYDDDADGDDAFVSARRQNKKHNGQVSSKEEEAHAMLEAHIDDDHTVESYEDQLKRAKTEKQRAHLRKMMEEEKKVVAELLAAAAAAESSNSDEAQVSATPSCSSSSSVPDVDVEARVRRQEEQEQQELNEERMTAMNDDEINNNNSSNTAPSQDKKDTQRIVDAISKLPLIIGGDLPGHAVIVHRCRQLEDVHNLLHDGVVGLPPPVPRRAYRSLSSVSSPFHDINNPNEGDDEDDDFDMDLDDLPTVAEIDTFLYASYGDYASSATNNGYSSNSSSASEKNQHASSSGSNSNKRSGTTKSTQKPDLFYFIAVETLLQNPTTIGQIALKRLTPNNCRVVVNRSENPFEREGDEDEYGASQNNNSGNKLPPSRWWGMNVLHPLMSPAEQVATTSESDVVSKFFFDMTASASSSTSANNRNGSITRAATVGGPSGVIPDKAMRRPQKKRSTTKVIGDDAEEEQDEQLAFARFNPAAFRDHQRNLWQRLLHVSHSNGEMPQCVADFARQVCNRAELTDVVAASEGNMNNISDMEVSSSSSEVAAVAASYARLLMRTEKKKKKSKVGTKGRK